MRIFSRSTLTDFWLRHANSEASLRLWFAIVERAAWSGPADVKKAFPSADFVADNRVVFNIKGNHYRLIAHIKYGPLFVVYIRFIGTHAEYDRVDAVKV